VEGIPTIPLLEKAMLASLALVLIAVMAGQEPAITVTALIAGGLSLLRIILWQGWRVREEPLLWILHLSLLWIPVALWLLAGSGLGLWRDTVWMHAVGIGAMGGLILGVISRVALGHTGRPLKLPAGMVTAFALIHLASLLRVGTGLMLIPWTAGVSLSALLWVVAYALFLIRYTRILASPRYDGKPG